MYCIGVVWCSVVSYCVVSCGVASCSVVMAAYHLILYCNDNMLYTIMRCFFHALPAESMCILAHEKRPSHWAFLCCL